MHPIDRILEEYGTTRYAFQKKYGYSKNRFYNIVERHAAINDLAIGIIHDMSECFGLTMDEVYSKLTSYEEEESQQ